MNPALGTPELFWPFEEKLFTNRWNPEPPVPLTSLHRGSAIRWESWCILSWCQDDLKHPSPAGP